MSASIRPATASDLRLLREIEESADGLFVERFGADDWPPADDRSVELGKREFILVAADGSDAPAAGFVHVIERDAFAHLEQLSVMPSESRRGLGSALVVAAKREARRRGHDTMTLRTFADVPWNAPFYARHGFVIVDDGGDQWLAALVAAERDLGLDRFGRRVLMRAPLPA